MAFLGRPLVWWRSTEYEAVGGLAGGELCQLTVEYSTLAFDRAFAIVLAFLGAGRQQVGEVEVARHRQYSRACVELADMPRRPQAAKC